MYSAEVIYTPSGDANDLTTVEGEAVGNFRHTIMAAPQEPAYPPIEDDPVGQEPGYGPMLSLSGDGLKVTVAFGAALDSAVDLAALGEALTLTAGDEVLSVTSLEIIEGKLIVGLSEALPMDVRLALG